MSPAPASVEEPRSPFKLSGPKLAGQWQMLLWWDCPLDSRACGPRAWFSWGAGWSWTVCPESFTQALLELEGLGDPRAGSSGLTGCLDLPERPGRWASSWAGRRCTRGPPGHQLSPHGDLGVSVLRSPVQCERSLGEAVSKPDPSCGLEPPGVISLGEVTQLAHRTGWKAGPSLWLQKPASRKGWT